MTRQKYIRTWVDFEHSSSACANLSLPTTTTIPTMKFSPAEFDDALPRYEDLSPRVSLEAFKPPMIHTTNSVSGWRESDLDRGVAVSGCFPSRPALVRSPGKLFQSAWGACRRYAVVVCSNSLRRRTSCSNHRRALSVFSTQPPAPAPIPFYHIEQANTAVQIRMSHTLSLLIAVLCDSTTPSKQDLETEDFDQEQVFRNQWATPTIIHLRNQQRDGSLSPAMAREVGIFCRFLNDTVLSMSQYDAAERASTARLAWQAVNQNDFSILGDSFDEDETASYVI
ncbi:hypothetical protein DL93DRAFT_844526 [Clavulina sp. PMI_390]|nr:hypothetical protein DL93DRAFT_844526 [Clavulina sp. PMI_390]